MLRARLRRCRFMCDLNRQHRGTVSNLIRASVKVHRSVVAVSMCSKSSASSVRNLMTNWTWVALVTESQFCSGLTIRHYSAFITLVLPVCWWWREITGSLTRVTVQCGAHLEGRVTLASDLIITESPGEIRRSWLTYLCCVYDYLQSWHELFSTLALTHRVDYQQFGH